ncbi:MAG: SpoIIE family protein phosphatase [Thermoanaerobaculia bacterium]|nr:SpoIIE family protein phosphatase [Thermoanaerobaculia bacterium]
MSKLRKSLLLIWLASVAAVIVESKVSGLLDGAGRYLPGLEFLQVLTWITLITLTIYWFALVFRYLLRKLFWRVGRRLLLSYLFIGALPFVIFAVLLLVMGYLMGGALSRAAVRSERQATLVRMDRWNLEYSLSGRLPKGEGDGVEVYDTAKGKSAAPDWLLNRSFSGIAARSEEAIFVSSRVYVLDNRPRTITLVMPIDQAWSADVQARAGFFSANFVTWDDNDSDSPGSHRGATIDVNGERREFHAKEGDEGFDEFFGKHFPSWAIFWIDQSGALVEWDSGATDEEKRVVTLIVNPITNLRDTYFGGQEYSGILIRVIIGIGSTLFVMYAFAALFAGMLIFSITRAVNRIEKGTKAVERGDFSYRIRMNKQSQLGEMAQSFDHMTESIAKLLHRVAEQERLQSEIDIAASIQRNLLPKGGPTLAGVSFAAHFEPSAAIGGDYYDVFSLDRGRLAVAIGDVSGHGLSTGLVMAMVKAAMTTLVEEGCAESALFRRLNDLVFRSTDKRAFMTLGFTIFDLDRRAVRHTNAGHIYPYVLREGEPPFAIEAPSLPLGVRADIETETAEIELKEGDTFVYLSDGIIEAQSEDQEPFGFEALEKILESMVGHSPAEIQDEILRAVARHAGDRRADDDRTVMILRFEQLEALHTRAELMGEAVVS